MVDVDAIFTEADPGGDDRPELFDPAPSLDLAPPPVDPADPTAVCKPPSINSKGTSYSRPSCWRNCATPRSAGAVARRQAPPSRHQNPIYSLSTGTISRPAPRHVQSAAESSSAGHVMALSAVLPVIRAERSSCWRWQKDCGGNHG